MFKCKHCGRGFSANLPERCPDCRQANPQPDSATSGRFWSFLLIGSLVELVFFAVLVGIVVVLLLKYL